MPEEPPHYSYAFFVGWVYQSRKTLLGVKHVLVGVMNVNPYL